MTPTTAFDEMPEVKGTADSLDGVIKKCFSGSVSFTTLSFSCCVLQHFQKVIPHQLDSGPDKVIQAAYQVKYNGKKMKK